MAEGKITSYDKGELAVKLKDMEFEEDEALLAADNCENVYSATKFLHQECELCASRMNVKEVTWLVTYQVQVYISISDKFWYLIFHLYLSFRYFQCWAVSINVVVIAHQDILLSSLPIDQYLNLFVHFVKSQKN